MCTCMGVRNNFTCVGGTLSRNLKRQTNAQKNTIKKVGQNEEKAGQKELKLGLSL